MIARYESAIRALVDELTVRGYAIASKAMLRHWYSQDRMSKTVWRDIASKLPEDWGPKDVLFFEKEDVVILLAKANVFELEENI